MRYVEVKFIDSHLVYHAIGSMEKPAGTLTEFVIFENTMGWGTRPIIIEENIVREIQKSEIVDTYPEYLL